ncbi:DNA (cytosine-5)-methyltransferase DRM2-like [Vicia villosa]|uniref:DNA (cytosine-5)-methyltransferase DRM2-like n=1 Tax=Vicia villosa TaxID=3911 RepID=UPI00273ABC59|nr:DNA (cytosine-5)-methyltransferase DRM2-like [Vicia villosa]XP_058778650.1 DNA (cytosine-5)-methyltransferase DRM2-like [Vicia villosa]
MTDDSGLENGGYDWNTDDELEIEGFHSPPLTVPYGQTAGSRSSEENSFAAGPSNTKVFDCFINMGFRPELISKVIQEYGEENQDKLLEEILTYQELESCSQQQQQVELDPTSSEYAESSSQQQQQVEPDPTSSEYAASSWDDSSDDDYFYDEEMPKSLSENDDPLLTLVKMGFNEEEALVALERLGPNSSLVELVDFISAAQVVKSEDALLPPEDKPQCNGHTKPRKRSLYEYEVLGRKKPKVLKRTSCDEEDESQANHLPNPMVGFGIPTDPNSIITYRRLPHDASGPPYFYYENVALTPKGVWQTISRFLYDVEPEYVDSKYFCAAARKRGYIHNLPIANRFPLLPLPPRTILDAFPLWRKWWPSWDPRTKLNCLQTVHGSARLTQRIRTAVEQLQDFDDPPENVKKFVLEQCRKWNLVWVGRNKVAPLEPDEVEMLLGFPRNHTRGGGISRTDRFKSLGNSFQVDTVAYHLSVLKEMFPNGINVLSLFSGIGGAEVALHRLGIPLKTVVSVEKSEVNRNIVRSWWEQTNQRGNLIDMDDVQQLDADRLEQLMSTFGAFDLVVGGSPCNNLAGSNRVTRTGLEGSESALFYDYFRIIDLVKAMAPRFQGHGL